MGFSAALAATGLRAILLHGNELGEVSGSIQPVGAGTVIGTAAGCFSTLVVGIAVMLVVEALLLRALLRLRGQGQVRTALRILAATLLITPLLAAGGGSLVGQLFHHMSPAQAAHMFVSLGAALAVVALAPASLVLWMAGRRRRLRLNGRARGNDSILASPSECLLDSDDDYTARRQLY